MQKSTILEDKDNNYVIIPVEYSNETGKIIPSSEKVKVLRKEFVFFEEAIKYGNSLKMLES